MGRAISRERRLDVEEVLGDLEQWAHQCHAASLAIVKAKVFPEARVARGSHPGVMGQHSWVVVGTDVYQPQGIVDPTLWSYDSEVTGVVYEHRKGHMRDWTPKGSGLIWHWGCPEPGGGEEIDLGPLSAPAEMFLRMARNVNGGAALDRQFYMTLVSSAPVGGWPAREIVEALIAKGHEPWVPIDIVGHLTDRNPGGLYLPGEED